MLVINNVPKKVDSLRTGSPKIYADVYLDDRGLRFEGKFDNLLEKIEQSVHSWYEAGTDKKDGS